VTAYLNIRILIPLYVPCLSTWLPMVSELNVFINTAQTNFCLKRVTARPTGRITLFARQQLNSCHRDAYRNDKYSPQVSAQNTDSSMKHLDK